LYFAPAIVAFARDNRMIRPEGDVMLVNGDGLLLKLPPNMCATSLAVQPIVGDVVIVSRRQIS
jgi:hypothetical protein